MDSRLPQHQTAVTQSAKRKRLGIKEGIPLITPVVDDLLDIARKTGILFEAKVMIVPY